jgi:D-glycero-D-manno-heptose 1,7-bisphosphate phosphatase
MLVWLSSPQSQNSRVLLLDRDGVLNVNRPDYVKNLGEVSFYKDALEALKLLKTRGIEIILISNQSGVNRGLITPDDFWATHEGVVRQVEEYGGGILAAFYCPHRPDENCECRKPASAMITAACRFAGTEPAKVFFLGDSNSDMMAARNAGCQGVRLCRGGEADEMEVRASGRPYYTSLMDAVLVLFGNVDDSST